MEETLAERQLTAATELLPMFVSMAASVTLGFIVKDFLGERQSSPRIDVLDIPSRKEKNSQMIITQGLRQNSFNTPQPPSPVFEYQRREPYYQNVIQPKNNLLNFIMKQQQKQKSFQDPQLQIEMKQKGDKSKDRDNFDFQPFFPNYNGPKPPRLLERKDYDSFVQPLGTVNPHVPGNNKMEWDKFLDTKTVVAGVDIVNVNDYYSDYFE